VRWNDPLARIIADAAPRAAVNVMRSNDAFDRRSGTLTL